MPKNLMIGNKRLLWAPIENGTFGTPRRWRGLNESESESEQDSETVYSDDEAYYVLEGASTSKLTIKTLQIPEDFAETCLGWKETAEGAHVVTGNVKPCVLVIENTVLDGDDNEKTARLSYYYNAIPSLPKTTSKTDEEKPKPNEIEIEFKCLNSSIATDADGIFTPFASIERTSTNAAFFDRYLTEVLVPTKTTATLSEGGEE